MTLKSHNKNCNNSLNIINSYLHLEEKQQNPYNFTKSKPKFSLPPHKSQKLQQQQQQHPKKKNPFFLRIFLKYIKVTWIDFPP